MNIREIVFIASTIMVKFYDGHTTMIDIKFNNDINITCNEQSKEYLVVISLLVNMLYNDILINFVGECYTIETKHNLYSRINDYIRNLKNTNYESLYVKEFL